MLLIGAQSIKTCERTPLHLSEERSPMSRLDESAEPDLPPLPQQLNQLLLE